MSTQQPTRRSVLRWGCGHCLGVAGLFGAGAGFAQTGPAAGDVPTNLMQRFARPSLDTDEGGLWAMMDREETRLRRSPFLLRDKALTQYVQDLACRLGGDHCPDIRVHIVRTPLFNANMAPNGMMQVWTGLLLRVENEAQLAAVLGHEIGHYLERHSTERMRDAKSRLAFAQFMGLFGVVGALGQLGVLAGAFAFSREHETRADRLGMQLMQRAGYEGQQAAQVWENLLGELKITGGEDVGKRSPMMATHPPVETRRSDLLQLAGEGGGKLGVAEFRSVTAAHRMDWLQDEIKRGQFEESLVLFNRMLAAQPEDAQALFARGEIFRQRAGAADLPKSLADLTASVAQEAAPVQAYRSLGLVHRQLSDTTQANQAFEKYLSLAPDASDANLIKNYISGATL